MSIATLHPAERVEIDGDRVGRLRRQLGAREADMRLSAALEELAYWLYHFERARMTAEAGALALQAARIAELAKLAGLVTVHRVAEALASLGSETALAAEPARAALAHRLVRTGERSILEIWELQDMSL